MKGFLKGLLKGGGKDNPLSYGEAREMARHTNMNIRMELAVRSDVNPEILYFLSEDPAAEVRRLIAGNEVTPAQADLVLTKDTDQDVRGDLAAKIAKLAPDLSADEQDKVKRMTYEALEILARDQVTRPPGPWARFHAATVLPSRWSTPSSPPTTRKPWRYCWPMKAHRSAKTPSTASSTARSTSNTGTRR